MAQEIIDVGSGNNAGDGEPVRSAFVKVNNNFTELYTDVSNIETSLIDVNINNIVSASTDYVSLVNDYVLVTSSSVDITITLPTAIGVSGKEINISKVDATTYNTIVDTTLSQTIIGETTITISEQYTNVSFVSDGTNWLIK